MTPLEATQVVIMLLATFPSAKIEPAAKDARGNTIPNTGTAATYARLLADLDATTAAAAIERVAGTHRYPTILPAVAEIREAALALERGEVRTGLEAWGDVQALLRPTAKRAAFSSHRPPTAADVADPIAFACIDAIGWRSICMADEDDPGPRARFIEGYERQAATARRETLTATLPGVQRLRELRMSAEERQARIAASGDPTERRRLVAGDVSQPIASVLQVVTDAAGGRR